MTYTGNLRLHFNRHGAFPLVWCVATDNWELAVALVTCTAPLRTVYIQKATADEEDGKPSAWLETINSAVLRVVGTTAFIEAA